MPIILSYTNSPQIHQRFKAKAFLKGKVNFAINKTRTKIKHVFFWRCLKPSLSIKRLVADNDTRGIDISCSFITIITSYTTCYPQLVTEGCTSVRMNARGGPSCPMRGSGRISVGGYLVRGFVESL